VQVRYRPAVLDAAPTDGRARLQCRCAGLLEEQGARPETVQTVRADDRGVSVTREPDHVEWAAGERALSCVGMLPFG
jgi:hypothetical protein